LELRIKYDRTADALYIKLGDGPVADSDMIAPGIIVDYNEKGEIIGIEILEFSKQKLDLTKLVIEGPEKLVAEV